MYYELTTSVVKFFLKNIESCFNIRIVSEYVCAGYKKCDIANLSLVLHLSKTMMIQETYLISLLLLAGRLRATTFSVNSFANTFLISRKMTVEKVFFWRRKKKNIHKSNSYSRRWKNSQELFHSCHSTFSQWHLAFWSRTLCSFKSFPIVCL